MLNIETELDQEEVTRKVVVQSESRVTQRVAVTIPANAFHSYLARDDSQWGWEELRDYVVDEIEKRSGPFPRKSFVEASIFKRFVKEFGANSAAIARYAFEVSDGRWAGAPISINRFCAGSDDFFARPIYKKIIERQGRPAKVS